jgi:hypothetical protein
MATPPGEPSSVDNPSQPLPHQPPLPTPTQPPAAQPTQGSPKPATRKPRQRRRTDSATPNRSEDQKSDQRQEGLPHPPRKYKVAGTPLHAHPTMQLPPTRFILRAGRISLRTHPRPLLS